MLVRKRLKTKEREKNLKQEKEAKKTQIPVFKEEANKQRKDCDISLEKPLECVL